MILLRINHYVTLLNTIFVKLTKSGLKVDKKVRIDRKTVLLNKGTISISKNVYLRSNPRGYHAGMPFSTCLLVDIPNAQLSIGENTRINGAYIHAQKSISIGKNCLIAAGVNILDSDGHQLYSPNRVKSRDIPKEIIIGNNVWIGVNAVILKGSVIGDNSVVSAGSVVKGSFGANSLIIGNPAKAVNIIKLNDDSHS